MIYLHEGARAVRPRKSGDRALVLRLAVAGSQPEVWRRLLVRESLWLSRLHDGIQIAFDWFDYQTHVFSIGDRRLGNPVTGPNPVDDDRTSRSPMQASRRRVGSPIAIIWARAGP